MNKQITILEGLKVLDLTRILTGPYCTQILADMGAQIDKIEDVGPNTNERSWPPYAPRTEESTYFLGLNRGKQSIELNLKDQKAKEIVETLAAEADIVVENFAPGVANKLGVGYETIKKVKPDIIYLSISCFGQTGPLSKLPGYDMLAQAMGGLLSITGLPERPMRVGSSMGDIIAGLYGAISILGAVNYRHNTGEGQHIDISLVDCVFTCLENFVPAYTICNQHPERRGSRHPDGGPYDVYACKDGYVCIVATNEKLWGSMCKLMGCPELATDPKFNSNQARLANIEEMTDLINEWMQDYAVAEVIQMCRDGRVPVAPILEIPQIVASEHTKLREMLIEYDHTTAGLIKVPGNPMKFGAYNAKAELPPPFKGQHNVDILTRLGFDPKTIEDMIESGIVGDGHIVRAEQ